MADVKKTFSKKTLSVSTSVTLDILGFNKECIRERIHAMDRLSQALSITTKRGFGRNDVERILTGSIREGVGLFFLNDTDFLQIEHGVICGTDCKDLIDSGKLVFEMVQKDAPSGYCFLKLLEDTPSPTNAFLKLQHALIQFEEGIFLSSAEIIANLNEISLEKGVFQQNDQHRLRYGPSLRNQRARNCLYRWLLTSIDMAYFDTESSDYVRAFPCKADSFLQDWKCRERQSGWPNRKIIKHVISLPGYVVPVGQKGTSFEELQWRICFTDAEIYLIQALNDTQRKIYIILKLIAKHVLCPMSGEITSYVMKIVMLWLAEKIPQKKFRRKHLLERLSDALIYLRNCVRNKNLPNYMIPKRNMFAGKMKNNEQSNIIEKLDFFLENSQTLMQELFKNDTSNRSYFNDQLISLFIASWCNKVIALQIDLHSTTESLADYLEALLQSETYWQRLWMSIPEFLKFFLVYGNRPLSIEFIILSRAENILKQVKQQQKHGQNPDGHSHDTLEENSDNNVGSQGRINDIKWIIPFQLLFNLYFFILIYLFGMESSMYIHAFVLYQWFLEDKVREKNCRIMSVAHLVLALLNWYKTIMICWIGESIFKPYIILNNGTVLFRTMEDVQLLTMDCMLLSVNAETIYLYV